MRPGLCRSIALSGLSADWPNSPSTICRSNYYSVSLFVLAVGLVGRCRYLRLLLCLLVGCRYLRLLSDLLVGADVSAAPLGLNKCISTINPGLAP